MALRLHHIQPFTAGNVPTCLHRCHVGPNHMAAPCSGSTASCSTVSGRVGSRRERMITRAQAGDDGFTASVKKIAKQVQGALPIVGLISRLTSPGGGFGEMSYSEFCRDLSDNGEVETRIGFADLETAYGKPANPRWILVVLWMAKHGAGLVPVRDMVNSARRLRVTQDIEIEIDRFENARDSALQKLAGISPPEVALQQKAELAVDLISILNFGLAEGTPVPQKDHKALIAVLKGAFREAKEEQLTNAIITRQDRTYGYA